MTDLQEEIMELAPLADAIERLAMVVYGEDYVRNEVGVEGKTVPELVDEYREEKSRNSTETSTRHGNR